MSTQLTPCRFHFDGEGDFLGLTDGTTWNGFDNVWVTWTTHADVKRAFRATYGICPDIEETWRHLELSSAFHPLVSYAYGSSTQIAWGDVGWDDDTSDDGDCAHDWAYTGSAYGGDDDSYHGEGRCYCTKCGADGDA